MTTSNVDTKTDEKMESENVVPLTDEQLYMIRHKLERTITQLWMDEPFLGGVSMTITKRLDTSCKTAYVGVNKHRFTEIMMGFNPSFFDEQSMAKGKGLIKHEVYHVLFQHIFDRIPADKDKRLIWNFGTDLAINSLIGRENLPDCGLFPGVKPKNCKDEKLADLIASFPTNEASEWYYDKLVEYAEEKAKAEGNSGKKGLGTLVLDLDGTGFDDHDGWGELPDELKDALREEIRGMIENGVRRVQEKNNHWGSVPFHIQEAIAKFLSKEIDWKSILRQFLGNIRTTERSSTIKRVNKKVPYVFPGVKRKTAARILFATDQSGSMADEEVQKAFAAIWDCSNETEVDVINWDTEVDEDSFCTWKKNQKHEWKRTRSGGTDVNCVAEFVNRPSNRGKWTGVVIFTDGYTPTLTGQLVGAKTLWLITENGTTECVRENDLVIQMKKYSPKRGL